MNNDEIKHKVHSAMYHQCKARGYATPVDVLMDIGILTRQKYGEWRFGRVPFLEAVCNANLKKLSTVMHEIRVYAKEHHLKPSFCYYKRWGMKKKGRQGHKAVVPLRFSKSGSPEIERWYSTHFVDQQQIKTVKAAQAPEESNLESVAEMPCISEDK